MTITAEIAKVRDVLTLDVVQENVTVIDMGAALAALDKIEQTLAQPVGDVAEALEYVRRVLLGAENTCVQNLPMRGSSKKRALKKIADTQRIFGAIEQVLIRAASRPAVDEGVLGKVREAIVTAYNTMSEAEKLIASAGLHDKWHEKDVPHRAFHDLLFKRADLKEALHLLKTISGEKT